MEHLKLELRVRVPILGYDPPGIERLTFDVICTPEARGRDDDRPRTRVNESREVLASGVAV